MSFTLSRGHVKRGALARSSGCNVETIRYYEDIKLMTEPVRSAAGHRLYSIEDQRRLRFILRCRQLGFSIDEIRSLLSMVGDDGYTCSEINFVTSKHLASVTQKIKDLRKLERTLKRISSECALNNLPDCPIVEALIGDAEFG